MQIIHLLHMHTNFQLRYCFDLPYISVEFKAFPNYLSTNASIRRTRSDILYIYICRINIRYNGRWWNVRFVRGCFGYALFEVVEAEAVGSLLEQVQQSVLDPKKFCSIVKLKAFQPFTTAENALENMMNVSEGVCHDDLKNFLETNLPSVKKASKSLS